MSKNDKLRSVEKMTGAERPCLGICAGKHCAKAGTKHILRTVRAALDECGLVDTIGVELTKCQDYCDDGPVATVMPEAYPYVELTPATARQIVADHLRDGKPVLALLHKRARKRLKKAAL